MKHHLILAETTNKYRSICGELDGLTHTEYNMLTTREYFEKCSICYPSHERYHEQFFRRLIKRNNDKKENNDKNR